VNSQTRRRLIGLAMGLSFYAYVTIITFFSSLVLSLILLPIISYHVIAQSIAYPAPPKPLLDHNNQMSQLSRVEGPVLISSKFSYIQSEAAVQRPPLTLEGNFRNNTTINPATLSSTFSTYRNSLLGIKIQYPSNWSKIEYPYNASGNNTIVAFFSPLRVASAMGNVSGVSGNFVPYIDIFEFASKNLSLSQMVKGALNNLENFNLSQSRPITLKGDISGQMLVYTIAIGGDELISKLQIWTMNNGKVYVITFNSQEGLYSKLLPAVTEMVNSFEIAKQQK
jgi:PsbP-like protein